VIEIGIKLWSARGEHVAQESTSVVPGPVSLKFPGAHSAPKYRSDEYDARVRVTRAFSYAAHLRREYRANSPLGMLQKAESQLTRS
jgi:hypothetical protein